jgi:hypothetical protein
MVLKTTKALGMEMSMYDTPVGLGKADDVANLVLYLASDVDTRQCAGRTVKGRRCS